MAFLVGRINNLILWGLASFFTSSITGKAPVPVPMTSLRHFHGSFSSVETGVLSEGLAESFGWFFLALADLHVVVLGRIV
jgi:hypothetical protein